MKEYRVIKYTGLELVQLLMKENGLESITEINLNMKWKGEPTLDNFELKFEFVEDKKEQSK